MKRAKRLAFVSEPSYFDASYWAIDAYAGVVDARPWRKGSEVDRHLLVDLADLGVLYFEDLCRWHESQGRDDEIDMDHPHFGEWLSRLTRNFRRWHESVQPLARDIRSLFGEAVPSVSCDTLVEKSAALGRALDAAGTKYCLQLGDLSDQFEDYERRRRLPAKYRKVIEPAAARIRAVNGDEQER